MHTDFSAVNTPACEGRTDFFFLRDCFCFLISITAPVINAMISTTINTNRTTAIIAMTPRAIGRALALPTSMRMSQR